MEHVSHSGLSELQTHPSTPSYITVLISSVLFKFIATILIVFSPVILYYKQYLIIKKKKSKGSFSHFLCLVVIFGSIFRTLFFIGNPFDTSMLFQGFCLLTVQVIFSLFFLSIFSHNFLSFLSFFYFFS